MTVLEKISNVAVIIAALCVGGTAVYSRIGSPSVSAGSDFGSRYKGKPIPLAGYQKGVPSVLIFASRACHFCSESLPFYQRLATMRDSAPGTMRLVSAFPTSAQSAEETRKYFSDGGVVLDDALPARFPFIGVRGTPTVALVDSGGNVSAVWTGKLSPDGEAGLMREVKSLCPACKVAGTS